MAAEAELLPRVSGLGLPADAAEAVVAQLRVPVEVVEVEQEEEAEPLAEAED